MNEREQIMNLLKPKKKAKEIRDRKTNRLLWVLAAVGIALALLFAMLGRAQQVDAAIQDDERPRCAMGSSVPEPHENHVEFAASWENGSPTGEYPFQFGDGTYTVLTGTVGGVQFSHDYAYEVGGIVTYTAGFTVTNELTTTVCHIEHWIVIDDRPELPPPPPATMTEKVFLPLMFNQMAPPSVSLDPVVGPQWNRVTVKLVWSGANEQWHTLQFGDGSSTDVYGSSGSKEVVHDYAYPGGDYNITFEVIGPGGTTTSSIEINLVP